MDGMLSQDEINALLNGEDTGGEDSDMTSSEGDNTGFVLEESEKDAVGEISNISMGTAATTLSSLLNQKVNITTPSVSISTWDILSTKYDRPCVMMQISYREGIDGNNVLILKEQDVRIITDLMMGGSGEVNDDEDLTELHLSAIGEAMNQMMGSAATSMSSMFNRKIDISPPVANIIDTYNTELDNLPEFLLGQFVMVAFKMEIGDLINSEIMQLYPIDFAKELLQLFSIDSDESSAASEPVANAAPEPTPAPQGMAQQGMQGQDMSQGQGMPNMGMPQQMPMQGMGMQGQDMSQGMPYGYPPQGMPMQMPYGYPPQQNVNVSQASFQPFSNDMGGMLKKENIDLIMDVPLEVTVELGRTSKSIKDILEFAPGTIVELNKIAGEAIDVLVNGKYVAKGEVVVIEESFGVRITEIIKE